MSAITRLRSDEFGRLKSIHDGFCPDFRSSIAIVAREQGEIVGRIFVLAPLHVEGPWIREDKRGSGLAARLIKRAEEEAQASGVVKVFAYAVSDEISDYLQRLGYSKEPWTVWSKEL